VSGAADGPAIAVVGAGAFGTALAVLVASDATPVWLWARRAEAAAAIAATRENGVHLPGVRLPGAVRVTCDLEALADAGLWLLAVPAQHMRAVLAQAPVGGRPALVITAKGLEAETLMPMGEVAAAVAPGCAVAILSGPSFAADIARGKPTAVTLAAADLGLAAALAARLARPFFRPYASDDPLGAQVGGFTKNVLAIACGVVVGAELGESARAALVTRGFAEMTRLGLAMGARAETLAGLSGLGDLVLTAGSLRSRNMALGVALARGQTADAALAGRTDVAEGAATAPALRRLAGRLEVDMPICEAVAALLAGELALADAIAGLLARPLRAETDLRGA
jgi:glycerol-3-phosphate dehydrogenase (NAD(P)+)